MWQIETSIIWRMNLNCGDGCDSSCCHGLTLSVTHTYISITGNSLVLLIKVSRKPMVIDITSLYKTFLQKYLQYVKPTTGICNAVMAIMVTPTVSIFFIFLVNNSYTCNCNCNSLGLLAKVNGKCGYRNQFLYEILQKKVFLVNQTYKLRVFAISPQRRVLDNKLMLIQSNNQQDVFYM